MKRKYRLFRLWLQWRRLRKGIKLVSLNRGPGYYLFLMNVFHNPVGEIQELEMESGKIGLYELLSYERYSDPWDMTKESKWHFIGYKGEKPVKNCTFQEYRSIYFPHF